MKNDIKKDNPLKFLKIITLVWHFGQKHDFPMLVKHINIIIDYFNF
jgi:hypothetical protein